MAPTGVPAETLSGLWTSTAIAGIGVGSRATVAERAGFKHQEYMGAVFRARIGQTPARVRKEAR
jgi:methylphosphotriester-DNA--protein-cysteine methyltransferase